MFTLLNRPENQILVVTISTISMYQNFSISFSAAPGGAEYFFRTFGHPPGINCYVQSMHQGGLWVTCSSLGALASGLLLADGLRGLLRRLFEVFGRGGLAACK